MRGDLVAFERAVLFRKSHSGSTTGYLDSSRSGFYSTESRSEWIGDAREEASVPGSKKKRRFAKWPRLSTK
jgi:hypothetical protein